MLNKKQPSNKLLQIRLTEDEKNLVSSKAKEGGKTVTEYVKEAIKEKIEMKFTQRELFLIWRCLDHEINDISKSKYVSELKENELAELVDLKRKLMGYEIEKYDNTLK